MKSLARCLCFASLLLLQLGSLTGTLLAQQWPFPTTGQLAAYENGGYGYLDSFDVSDVNAISLTDSHFFAGTLNGEDIAFDAAGNLYVGVAGLDIYDAQYNLLGHATVPNATDGIPAEISLQQAERSMFIALRTPSQVFACNPIRDPYARLFTFDTHDVHNPVLTKIQNIPGTDAFGGSECRGIRFDAAGHLWVCSYFTLTKLTLDAQGNILAAEKFLVVENPQNVAFDPATGRVFSAGQLNLVGVIDPATGAPLAQIHDVCEGPSTDGVPIEYNPGDLVINDNGDLFVRCGHVDGDIVAFSAAGLAGVAGDVEASALNPVRVARPELFQTVFLTFKPAAVLTVAIDIKPGDFPNTINLGSQGTVAVAILSSPSFDATSVDPSSVTLAASSVAMKGQGTWMASVQDVNGDGLPDLVVHVATTALVLTSSSTTATLEAQTFDGRRIRGQDSVVIVP